MAAARLEPSAVPSPAEPGGAGIAAGFQSSPGKRSASQPGAGLPPPAKLGGPLGSAPAASGAGGSGRTPGVPVAAGAGAAEAAAGGRAGARRLRDGIDAAGEAGAGDGASGRDAPGPGETGPAPLSRPGRPLLGNASLRLLREAAEGWPRGCKLPKQRG